jgi:hypothetical protein
MPGQPETATALSIHCTVVQNNQEQQQFQFYSYTVIPGQSGTTTNKTAPVIRQKQNNQEQQQLLVFGQNPLTVLSPNL